MWLYLTLGNQGSKKQRLAWGSDGIPKTRVTLAYTINPFGPSIVFFFFTFTLFFFPAPSFVECGTSQWFSPSCAMTPVRYCHLCWRKGKPQSASSLNPVCVLSLACKTRLVPSRCKIKLHVSEIADIVFRKALVFVYRCLDAHASSLFTHYYTAIVCATGGNHRLTRGQEARLLSLPFLPDPAGRASTQFSSAIGNICIFVPLVAHSRLIPPFCCMLASSSALGWVSSFSSFFSAFFSYHHIIIVFFCESWGHPVLGEKANLPVHPEKKN